jgi:hypothetical protein
VDQPDWIPEVGSRSTKAMKREDVKDSDTFFRKGKRVLRRAEIGDTFMLEHIDGTPYRVRMMGYAKNGWGEVAVLYVFSRAGSALSPFDGGTGLKHLLLPPICGGMEVWRRGFARFEARIPVAPRDRLAVHCFAERFNTHVEPMVPITFVDEQEHRIAPFRPYGVQDFFLELGVMTEILIRHSDAYPVPTAFQPDSLASKTVAANGEVITLESMSAELASPYPTKWPGD